MNRTVFSPMEVYGLKPPPSTTSAALGSWSRRVLVGRQDSSSAMKKSPKQGKLPQNPRPRRVLHGDPRAVHLPPLTEQPPRDSPLA
jgi:hypothetical protein